VTVAARDDAGVATAVKALLYSLRKPQDGWISKLINRRISLAVTRVLVPTGIRPNQLSVVILAIGLYGAWLAARGTTVALAWGGVLFQLQSILDGCDGELSRLGFRGSKTGEWLDTVGDDLTNYAFFGGAAIGLHRMGLGSTPLVLGAIGVTLGVITSGIEYKYLVSIGSGDLLAYPLGFGNDPEPVAQSGTVAKILGALRPAFKRDFFVFLAMLMAIAGAWTTLVMLALFVAGAIATFTAVVASEIRRAGQRTAR
jgi:phosphatidylglycerophosphate synthase